MEIRLLQSFVAVARERHFGKAANALHLSQPTLTGHIQRLERDLGAVLVERAKSGIELTPAGNALLAHARDILRQVQRARDDVRNTANGARESLRIGHNYVARRRILPGLLAHLATERPGLTVTTWERLTGHQLGGVRSGELDLGFVYGYPHDRGVAHHLVAADIPIVAIVSRAHPLAERASVPVSELAEHRCVLVDRSQSPQLYDAITSASRRAGITLDIAAIADDPGFSGQLMLARDLVGFASDARSEILSADDTGPVAVPLTDPTPTVDLYAVWSASRTARPAVEEAVRWLQAT